jgi:DNA-binding LacI/PurR family transcriptional regulator
VNKSVTLKDIAEIAGVSTRTVARVVHNNGYVAADTRKQIEQVIEKTGYRVNIVARGLRKQQTFTIGHLLRGLIPNPFFAGVALGVEQQANKAGYSVLLFNVQQDTQRERQGLETLLERRVDAVIFTTACDAENVRMAMQSGTTVVQVERPTPVKTNLVLIDNYAGAVEAVEHLIDLGHRRIAFIGSKVNGVANPGYTAVDNDRLNGYLDTLREYDIPIDDRLIDLSSDYSVEDSEAATANIHRLLELSPPPTALFVGWDYMAAGIMQVLYERGLRIPDDMSIVGFDNTLAPYLSPPLTTVEQPMMEIGRAAARVAIEQIEREDIPPLQTVKLSTNLLIRESTGPAQ